MSTVAVNQQGCWVAGTLRAMLLADSLFDLFSKAVETSSHEETIAWLLIDIWSSVHGCCAMSDEDYNSFLDHLHNYDVICHECGHITSLPQMELHQTYCHDDIPF